MCNSYRCFVSFHTPLPQHEDPGLTQQEWLEAPVQSRLSGEWWRQPCNSGTEARGLDTSNAEVEVAHRSKKDLYGNGTSEGDPSSGATVYKRA